ncbi:MAG TPA: hypothetical protein VGL81_16470 [Polyangiaceae bacterium]
MSTAPEKPPLVTWKTIQRVADEARDERLDVKSDEELTRELRAAGFADDAADRIVDRALAGSQPRPPARRWVVVLAAAAVVLLALGAWKRREVVAWWEGPPAEIGPDRWAPPPRAVHLREEAFAACDAKQWETCGAKLDEAKALDPAGEASERVAGARAAIEAATTVTGDAGETPRKPRLK